jgi:hypothetical protein
MLMSAKQPLVELEEPAAFVPRHIGVAPDDEAGCWRRSASRRAAR